MRQQRAIIDAAHRLILARGSQFTTQELVKEAGVALQTFYRHFASKDHLLLALIETLTAEVVASLEVKGREIADPLARLRFYISYELKLLSRGSVNLGAQFVIAERWRLFQLFPEEMAQATKPFIALLEEAMCDAAAEGLIESRDHASDAWFMSKVVNATGHHYVFVSDHEPVDEIVDRLWSFCLTGFAGTASNVVS